MVSAKQPQKKKKNEKCLDSLMNTAYFNGGIVLRWGITIFLIKLAVDLTPSNEPQQPQNIKKMLRKFPASNGQFLKTLIFPRAI